MSFVRTIVNKTRGIQKHSVIFRSHWW